VALVPLAFTIANQRQKCKSKGKLPPYCLLLLRQKPEATARGREDSGVERKE